MTQDVDPQAIKQAGDAWREVHDEAAAAVTLLAGVLECSAGMAGSDNGAHAWTSKYDPLSRDVVGVASAVVSAAGKISDLLHATAVNHTNGGQQSAINNPYPPAVPPAPIPLFPVPSAPSAEGGFGDVPGWWHTIQAYAQGELWPNGHQDQLHAAAQAWRNTAAGLRAAAFSANGVMPYVANQKSPEIPAAIANCNKIRDAINSAAEGCDVAAKSCDDYASAIDAAHHQIVHEMEVLGGTVAVTEVVAAVLIPFTAGTSEIVSKVVDVSRLAAVGARIATIIREFRVAAELSALPTVSAAGNAAGNAARSISELGPLLAARPTIYAAETAGRGEARAVEGAKPPHSLPDREFDFNTRPERLDHTFDPKHKLDGVVEKAGGREQAMRQMLDELKRNVPQNGTFETVITASGEQVILRGFVDNGVIKIGTAFIP
jgi:hypothetical protein